MDDPQAAQLELKQAERAWQANDFVSAKKHILGALRNNGALIHAYLLLGKILAEEGQKDDARKAYEKGAALEADTAREHFRRGECFLRLEKFPEAKSDFKKGSKIGPDSYEGWHLLGECYLLTKDYADAEEALREAVRLNEKRAVTRLHLAQTYAALKRPELAEREFIAAVELAPEDAGIKEEFETFKKSGRTGY